MTASNSLGLEYIVPRNQPRTEAEIVQLARCSVVLESESYEAVGRGRRLGRFSVGEFLRDVDRRLPCKLSLNTASRLAGMSRAAFTRNFRASVGVSFHRYRIQRRIEAATTLLRDTDFDLDFISEETGFCSQGHFATVFRDLVGNTPGRFREQSRMGALHRVGPFPGMNVGRSLEESPVAAR